MKLPAIIKTIIQAGVCVIVAALGGVAAAPINLSTPQGELQGAIRGDITVETSGETATAATAVATFKHIPYALPPVGERRWRHAEPAPSWSGVRLATQFSPACLQPAYPKQSFYARAALPTSEDCLYLNVWTPLQAVASPVKEATQDPDAKTDEDAKTPLPVMVWIHGGALTRGSGANPVYDGTKLARKGVVVVSINYRLGVFGYMAHPEASAESGFGVSGNYATSDQVAALQWVQKNIAAFGGDPANVTIFGESAGSWSVHHMLATPRAKGLFHRAIGQSGARFGRMPTLKGDASSAHAQGIKLQTGMGVSSLADLRLLDGPTVLEASQRMRFGGVVDGVFFPEQLHRMFAQQRYNVVPLIVGYNADEGTTLGGLNSAPKSPEAYVSALERRYGDGAKSLLSVYPADTPVQSSLALLRDASFGHGMHAWARFNAQQQRDTYFYYFTHKPFGDPLGAFHAAEIAYVFGNVPVNDNAVMAVANQRLSDQMSDYWVAFAKTGKPVVDGAPAWPRYSAKKALHMEFGSGGAVRGRNSMGKRWNVLDKVLAKQREKAN